MRPRRNALISMNLDSLLDTMTNGVGILIVVLAVTQLSVGDAVQRTKAASDIPKVSPEVLELARLESQRLQELLAELRKTWGKQAALEPDQRVEIERLKTLISELEDLAKLPKEQVDKQKLEEILAEQKKRQEELNRLIASAAKKIQDLERQVATITAGAERPTVLRVPIKRPAPAGMKAIEFICRRGRIFPNDMEKLDKAIEQAIKDALPTGKITSREDQRKLEQHFEDKIVGDQFIRVKLKNLGTPSAYIEFVPRSDEQGETIADLHQPTSSFAAFLGNVNPKTDVIRFLVWSDSFTTYLEARKMTDEKKLFAGWIPFPEDYAKRQFLGTGNQQQGPATIGID